MNIHNVFFIFFIVVVVAAVSQVILASNATPSPLVSSSEFITLDASQAILKPGRKRNYPAFDAYCSKTFGSCLENWYTAEDAKWQLPSSVSLLENNTLSLLYVKPVNYEDMRNTFVRVSVTSPTYPYEIEQSIDFSPKLSSLFVPKSDDPASSAALTLPVPFSVKPNSYISVSLLRPTASSAWDLFKLYLNHPSLPLRGSLALKKKCNKKNEIGSVQALREPLHGPTYNPSHTVSSPDFPRQNSGVYLRFAPTDCYAIGGRNTQLHKSSYSTSETRGVFVSGWYDDSWVSFIVPHDWSGFTTQSSRRVKFIYQYTRKGKNADEPSIKVEIRNSSAVDELYGRVNPNSPYIKHQSTQPAFYVAPPQTGDESPDWYYESSSYSKYLLGAGEFDISPNATFNLTTYVSTSARTYYGEVWNLFNVYAVPIESVAQFLEEPPNNFPVVTQAPIPTSSPSTGGGAGGTGGGGGGSTGGGGSGGSSSNSACSNNPDFVSKDEYEAVVDSKQSVAIGLGVAFALTAVSTIILSIMLCITCDCDDEKKSKKYEKSDDEMGKVDVVSPVD